MDGTGTKSTQKPLAHRLVGMRGAFEAGSGQGGLKSKFPKVLLSSLSAAAPARTEQQEIFGDDFEAKLILEEAIAAAMFPVSMPHSATGILDPAEGQEQVEQLVDTIAMAS
ncbi:unnamed protein product [Discosporangium mesarthrocarpum]